MPTNKNRRRRNKKIAASSSSKGDHDQSVSSNGDHDQSVSGRSLAGVAPVKPDFHKLLGCYKCVISCDYFLGIPQSMYDPEWDTGMRHVVSKSLQKCCEDDDDRWKKYHDSDSSEEDTLTIDIRVLYVDDAIQMLATGLQCSKPPKFKFLNVVVGCKKHGVGMGLLRQEIIQLLSLCERLKWNYLDDEKSIICINRDVPFMIVEKSIAEDNSINDTLEMAKEDKLIPS